MSEYSDQTVTGSLRGGALVGAEALHRDVEVVAIRIGRARLRVGAVGGALGRRLDAALREPPGDLVLVVDLPAEMIEPRRLAVSLVLEQCKRDVAVGHVDRLAAGSALGGK